MRFEIYQVRPNALANLLAGEWRWRLKAANGKIIASGESFHNEADCRASIALVQQTTIFTPIARTPA